MKKAIALVSTLLMLALILNGCDGLTASNQVCSEDGGRVSGTTKTMLYYPCSISGPTAATTMSSGFGGNLYAMQWISNRLAEEGFVVLAFTPSNNMGPITGWRDAHKNCIARLQALNSSHRVLQGKIDLDKLQTCGHSRGASGSLLASADLTGTLKSTVALAPWQTSVGNAYSAITSPTLIQAGSSDSMAVPSMTQGAYNGLGNISKAYFVYEGMTHTAWSAAQEPTASILADGVIAWMHYYMDGDTSYQSAIASSANKTTNTWVDLGNGSSSSSSSSSSTTSSSGSSSTSSSSSSTGGCNGSSSSGGCN